MQITPYHRMVKRDHIRTAVRLLLRSWDAVRAAEKIHGSDISMDIIEQHASGVSDPRNAKSITDESIDASLTFAAKRTESHSKKN